VRQKAEDNKAKFDDAEETGAEGQEPLPHPQDGYGWEEENGSREQVDGDQDEEPLVRRMVRHTHYGSTDSSKRHHSGAQAIMERVSRAATLGKNLSMFVFLQY
jgi:hypothetical protein